VLGAAKRTTPPVKAAAGRLAIAKVLIIVSSLHRIRLVIGREPRATTSN
jgi:hypothetical protein